MQMGIAQSGYIWQPVIFGDSILENVVSDHLFNTQYNFDDINRQLENAAKDFDVPIPESNDYELPLYKNHKFLVVVDSTEYVLYGMEEIKLAKRKINVYELRTTLKGKWNDDFPQWIFYYTHEFGIIGIDYYSGLAASDFNFKQYFLYYYTGLSAKKQKILSELISKLQKDY